MGQCVLPVFVLWVSVALTFVHICMCSEQSARRSCIRSAFVSLLMVVYVYVALYVYIGLHRYFLAFSCVRLYRSIYVCVRGSLYYPYVFFSLYGCMCIDCCTYFRLYVCEHLCIYNMACISLYGCVDASARDSLSVYV